MRIATIALLAITLGFNAQVRAADFAGSGALLDTVRKIQGVWHRSCKTAAGDRYESVKLRFTYTHLIVESTYYAGDRCLNVSSTEESVYRYWLGDKLALPGNKTAYSLDLSPETVPDHVEAWHPANLIHYRDGKLLFGQKPGNSRQRAHKLDESKSFVRR